MKSSDKGKTKIKILLLLLVLLAVLGLGFALQSIDDADIVIVAYGASARVSHTAVDIAREKGIKAGLLRPITLWPYPTKAFTTLKETAKAFVSVEMSMGQMVDDVKLAV